MADEAPPRRRRRTAETSSSCCCTVITLTLVSIVIALICIAALGFRLFYIPGNPEFRVASAAVDQFNASFPPFVSSAVNFTVEARNPNKLVSIFYGPLSATLYVSGEFVPIAQPVILPPFSQKPKSTVTLSAVAVEAEAGEALTLELTGKLRFMAGAITRSRSGVDVACDLQVILKRGFEGQLPPHGSLPCQVTAF